MRACCCSAALPAKFLALQPVRSATALLTAAARQQGLRECLAVLQPVASDLPLVCSGSVPQNAAIALELGVGYRDPSCPSRYWYPREERWAQEA
jgi:hypothetical protein